MKFKVAYIEDGKQITEYCKTAAWAKKRARQVNGVWAKLGANE